MQENTMDTTHLQLPLRGHASSATIYTTERRHRESRSFIKSSRVFHAIVA
jgi:hypothetical protein